MPMVAPSQEEAYRPASHPEIFWRRSDRAMITSALPVLAYYLAKVDNLTQFKTADITRISKASALRVADHSLAVQHAANSYRYLASAGRGVKQLTPLGEAVVDALPDREKVKTAIAGLKAEATTQGRS